MPIVCEEGYELLYRPIGDGDYEWTCVKIALPSPALPPDPPASGTPCNELFPPINIICELLGTFGTWIHDTIKWGQEQVDGAISDTQTHLSKVVTDSLQWLLDGINGLIANLQTTFSTAIANTQAAIQKDITLTQEVLDKAYKDGVGGLHAVIDLVGGKIDSSTKATQEIFQTQITSVQKGIDNFLNFETGAIPQAINEIPQAIWDYVNDISAPFLKSLNDTLETV